MATTTLTPQAETYQRSWVLDWLTTVDHKKIGVLYIVNSFIFFFAAGILALVIRTELAVPGLQFLDPETYNQAFTMHGTIMIFLFVVPVLSGFANYVVPLQLGAPDMAFPRINALSFWMLPLGGGLIFVGLPVRRRRGRGLDRTTRRSATAPTRRASAPTCGSSASPWWAPPRSWARSTSSPRSSRCGRRG